jgi:epoxyqueuosine reductase
LSAYADLAVRLAARARELGFQDLAIGGVELAEPAAQLGAWLAAGYHGGMAWMAAHGRKRSEPSALIPGTLRVVSVRMDHEPGAGEALTALRTGHRAYIARYALGRDYHKLIRTRLQRLIDLLREEAGDGFAFRAFADSAPVMEKPLAAAAGLGWIGRNTLLLAPGAGSWFFLGEIYTDLPLPLSQRREPDRCGSCRACLAACPTGALVGARRIDARRCISYLTIEHRGAIPEELRPLLGNRVFGCDDCQLVCPWNRRDGPAVEPALRPRHGLDRAGLLDLFAWSEADYLRLTEGSALRRCGYPGWQRNLAVALGNAPPDERIEAALAARLPAAGDLVAEHIRWALERRRVTACGRSGRGST